MKLWSKQTCSEPSIRLNFLYITWYQSWHRIERLANYILVKQYIHLHRYEYLCAHWCLQQCTNNCKHRCAAALGQNNAITQLWRALRVYFQRVHTLFIHLMHYYAFADWAPSCFVKMLFYIVLIQKCFSSNRWGILCLILYIIYANTCACFSFLAVPKYTSCCTCCWLCGGVSHRSYLRVPVWKNSG